VLSLRGGGGTAGGVAPIFTCDPRLDGSKPGEKLLDINCIGFPAFGESGQIIPPYDLRTPNRFNNDLTLFKNFQIKGEQKLQFRVGFFNIFNTSFVTFATSAEDVDLHLNTTCNRTVDNVPNGAGGFNNGVCDPTGGFSFTQGAIDNFGKINLRRGRRVIEFALKYYF
jgi:hypothetical protein